MAFNSSYVGVPASPLAAATPTTRLPSATQRSYTRTVSTGSKTSRTGASRPLSPILPTVCTNTTPNNRQSCEREGAACGASPPSFDGSKRSPLPRFTTLTQDQLDGLRDVFYAWAQVLLPKLVPGANVVVASNLLLSYLVSFALAEAGLERRGEITRLVTTMRGGDRPKGAHKELAEVSVMPRSMWEPWLVYRRPLAGRVQDNLREWGTGGFRRPSRDKPFGDVIRSAPTRKEEREPAPHPSLKPQRFMRTVVRAVLPLAEGVVVAPFAGAGSTLAAAEAVGYKSIGIEKDEYYFKTARKAIPKLAQMRVRRKA